MPDTADVIDRAGTDKTVVLKIRQVGVQRVMAPGWTDLRVGFLLSLTNTTDPGMDDPTGLTEEIGTPPRPLLSDIDRFRIGLTDRATGTLFIGYTNRAPGRSAGNVGTSKLVSSDLGIGTTNFNFWRPKNEVSDNYSVMIVDQGVDRSRPSEDGSQIHFAQNPAGAGGYATLLSMRLTRPNYLTQAKLITLTVKKATAGGHSADVLFTDTPTKAILEANLKSFPTSVQQFGPYELSQEPDTLALYWPFHNSRLRIHVMGIVKVA